VVGEPASSDGFEELLEFLKQGRGFDFTGYKRASLQRRIDKRMRRVELDGYDEYLDFLQLHPQEFESLFNSILINVTSFFRDSTTWTYLRDEVLPRRLEQVPPERPIRAWVGGCASGEEAYTLAIVLAEILGDDEFTRRVKIYGTDVDEEALAVARSATYTTSQITAVPEDLRSKYFEAAGPDRHAFRNELRRSVVFGRLDLVHDAPISRLEVLTCRNTLMYFSLDTQARVIERFNFALNDGGILVLGKAETLLSRSELFDPVDRKRRIFRKVSGGRPREPLGTSFGLVLEAPPPGPDPDRHGLSFAAFPQPGLIFDASGVLVDANDAAQRLLGVGARDVGSLIQDLDISYRPFDLRTPVMHALREGRANRLHNVAWAVDGETTYFDVQVTPLQGDGLIGVAVHFDDTTRQRKLEERLELTSIELEQAYQEVQSTNEELETMNEELQSTIEELETTNEELQSTNEELETMNEELQSTLEELETTNEELQSTNEELETMNEELQSTNDELHTVNEELRVRGDEVDELNHFLQAVFESFGGGVVVVDEQRHVRVWNHRAEDLWGAREDEVAGLDLLNVDIGLPLAELEQPLDEVLSGGGTRTLTVDAVTRRGRPIVCRLAMTPLMSDGLVDGAIVVMEIVPPATDE
jgi:two-component system, chemotaxis family, CheB/CheR fusion protein